MRFVSEVLKLESTLILIAVLVATVTGIILISPDLPEVYKSATISCYSNENSRTWFHKELLLSICNRQACRPNKTLESGYTFTADDNKTNVTISSLNRTRDGGLWSCLAGVNQSIYLDVYSFPSGLSFTQGGATEVDLAGSQTILQCRTDGCTYSATIIRWYFKDIASSSPRTFYNDTGTDVTAGNCTSPEELYTSSLVLPLYTIWQGNIDKNVTFSCGIEYSNASRNVYSQESRQIRYAVRVSEAVLQQNNQNITNILTVTSGVLQTLACVTGTSRPPPTITWYLGSRQKVSGASLNFTPSDDDHNGTVYCQVYNTDQNVKIDSNKAKLYVKVPVTNVDLQKNSQSVPDNFSLTVTSGEPVTLTCIPGASRPAPTIEWYINSQMRSNGTSQSFTFTPENVDHNTIIYCQAYNINPEESAQSRKPKLYVRVAVASVSLLVSALKIVFYQGFSQLLICIASPSRPIPAIIWHLGSKQLTSNITLTNTRDVTGLYNLTSQISLTLSKDDNEQQIYCDASTDSQQPVANSSRHSVDVWYQPVKPNVKAYGGALGEFPWLENTTGVLRCNSSDYGNPKSSVAWQSHRGVMDEMGNLVIPDLLPSDHRMEISCQLTNQFTIDKSVPVSSQPLPLNVEYYPIINYNVSSPLKVNETQFVPVWCEARGNPNPGPAIWKNQTDGDTLRFDNISRQNTGRYMCEAIANSTKNGTLKRQKQLDIIVQYAPDIKVMLISLSQQNQSAVFICEAQGVPLENTFSPWVHIFGALEIQTGLQGKTNSTHSILTIDFLVLEDMGTYKCSANNGIMGTNRKLVQTDAKDIHVTGIPNILDQNFLFAREVGLSHNISIPFYSDPTIEIFNVQRNGTVIMNTTRTITYLLNGAVSYKIYGKTIMLEAQMVHFSIQNLTEEDLASYKLVLKNSLGSTEFIFQVNASGPPKMVDRFYFNRFVQGQIELHFDPGFNGGPDQTFVIEYKASNEFAWKNTGIEIQEAETQYRFSNGTFLVNITKPSPGSYEYRIYSWNIEGRSPFSESITVTIPSEADGKHGQDGLPVAAVAGGVGAAIFTIAVIAVILIIWKRRSHQKKTSEGDIYENVDPGGKGTNAYENSRRTGTDTADGNVNENPGAVAANSPLVNKDGLLYADLMLDPPTTKNGKAVIRGTENRTEYAEIAYGKRGEPLPDSDDQKIEGGEHKNKIDE